MIKVNLLRDQTVQTRRTAVAPTTSPLGWMMLAAMIFVLASLGGTWYYLKNSVAELTTSRNQLAAENTRVQALRKQIDQFEKMKRERQGRIDIINQLKANQTGPVQLLNSIIRSIPTGSVLWLTSIEQKGSQVRITGFTQSGETIPDLLSNLAATGYFKTVDLELYEDQQKEAARFTLVCVSAPKKSTE